MKGTASYLMKFLDGSQKRFIIPVYQRNYDWKKENCKQLFDDLVNVVREKKGKFTFAFMKSAGQKIFDIKKRLMPGANFSFILSARHSRLFRIFST